jgi:hypothetical protein
MSRLDMHGHGNKGFEQKKARAVYIEGGLNASRPTIMTVCHAVDK